LDGPVPILCFELHCLQNRPIGFIRHVGSRRCATLPVKKKKLPEWENLCNFACRNESREMIRRKYISLVLLAVYLLAAGGSAYMSLTCSCLEREHARGHVALRVCCADGHPDGEALCETCTCNRHSTEIRLYTTAADDASSCKCTVLALPHCLAAAQAARLSAPKFRKERIAAPPVAGRQAPCLRIAGLRAPPVSA